jgi:hypothetical protein
MRTSDFETAVAKLSAELAAEVLRLALMDMEIKYDPSRPRAPKALRTAANGLMERVAAEPRPQSRLGRRRSD